MDQPGYQLYVNLENVLLKAKAVSAQCYENELNFVCNFDQSDINKRNLETQSDNLKIVVQVHPEEASVQ
ncbi:hypothetical protein KUTeg_003510 [Tegillarca granosa]|uniref:Uncharacterized protein n=1 Tax=Tegillarca granosa TaxID=220873 RepID=A0ABQ9FMC0_TEGGR|nr:hypothetical protein KUTeg_003510 [Tegillarca granosa]